MNYKNEDELQKAVQNYLDALGIMWFHIPRNLTRKCKHLTGFPDLMCLGKGGVFFIELKTPAEKKIDVRKEQKIFYNECKKNNIKIIISNDVGEIIKFIKVWEI